MIRDPRLASLSADHHEVLAFARKAERGELDPAEVRREFESHALPHMEAEERLLLRSLGDDPLVRRLVADHDHLRALARAGEVVELGRVLIEHMAWEERVLFPACETRLPPQILAAVGAALGR